MESKEQNGQDMRTENGIGRKEKTGQPELLAHFSRQALCEHTIQTAIPVQPHRMFDGQRRG